MNATFDLAREVRAEAVARRARAIRLQRAIDNCSTVDMARWRNPRIRPLPWQYELGSVLDLALRASMGGEPYMATLAAPPRHGKTEFTGRAAPLVGFASQPGWSCLYVTSKGDRAEEVSMRVRAGVEELAAQGVEHLQRGPKWSTLEWETVGGNRWVGTGWEAATGGIGANLTIFDDVIGTSETYRSRTDRDRIWRVLQEDVLSRMETPAVVGMETRRGVDDTIARIQREWGDVWKHHAWPCLNEATGEYLWADTPTTMNYGHRWRATMPHLTDSDPVWLSLYQQHPVSEGGTVLQRDWFGPETRYQHAPEYVASTCDRVVAGVDLAFTGKASSDWCVVVVVGVQGALRYVLHVERFKAPYAEQRERVQAITKAWKVSETLVELAANGDAMLSDLYAVVPGIRGERAAADKRSRMQPHTPTMRAGQVRLPAHAPWLREFYDEITSVTGTGDLHDDQFDALAWALRACGEGGMFGDFTGVLGV